MQWFENNLDKIGPEVLLQSLDQLLRLTYDVTRGQLAGLEIIQSLRAVGPLQELRLASNRKVAEQFAVLIADRFGWPVDDELSMQSRLSVDMGYAVVELGLEDSTLSAEVVLEQGSRMIQSYWRDVLHSRSAAN